MKTYVEIAQTGNEHSIFVLEPNELTPQKQISFATQELAERTKELLFPNAVLLSKEDFVTEVQTRIENSLCLI